MNISLSLSDIVFCLFIHVSITALSLVQIKPLSKNQLHNSCNMLPSLWLSVTIRCR